MSMNLEIFKERTLFPLTEPDNQGKQRKLNIEPDEFNGDVEGLKFNYSWGKGEGVYFSAPYGMAREIFQGLEDVLRKPEKQTLSWERNLGQKGPITVHVGRGDDLVPFMALSGDVNGSKRTKKFFFYPAKGFTIKRDGQPISDLESRERGARRFVADCELFLEWLRTVYKPRIFNQQGGGNFGKGGYNGGGGNNNGGGQSGGTSAPANANFDDFI